MDSDPAWQEFLKTEAQVHFVRIGEHRLRVVEIGSGEPVLLVHGFADSVYTWHRNLRALARTGFRALAYDQPGCGESALPTGCDFGVDSLARLATRLMDTLGIAQAHLVGSSMGGGIGLQLAVHHPDRLRRVMLVAPTCYHALFRPFIYLLRYPPFGPLARHLSGPWLAEPVLHSLYGGPTLLTPAVLAQYRRAFQRPEYRYACVGLLRDYWNHAFTETSSLSRNYRKIRVPLHLVWGELDPWIGTHQALRLAADIGADLTVIAEAGHLVQQARPRPFNETVVRFLKSER
jgi:pimeloyl-ACP methyl ester carboxylesterase